MRRPIISLIVGAVLAAAALYLAYNARLNNNNAQAATIQGPVTAAVMVASEDLAFGEAIKADFIKVVEWPADAVPENIVTTRDELLQGPEGERIAIRSFVAGEPFLKSKVSGFGEKPTLSRKVAENMRAFSIRINDVSGVAGFLLPGDRVDVQLTRELNGNNDNLVTDVIIQNVSVLGIDQLASEEAEDPMVAKTATVEVTPEQAQKLALAQQLGTLSLTLRNHTNIESAEVKRITVSDLGIDTPRPVVRDTGIYVRVRKGADTLESERVPH